MADVDVNRVERMDPVQAWAEPLVVWLTASGVSPERSRRAVLAFGRFSAWVAGRVLGVEDVDEVLIDEYIAGEQERSGSRSPAAAQYLPLVKRFLAAQGVLVLRGPASRRRHGQPRLDAGPLEPHIGALLAWAREQGYAPGTIASVVCTAARLGHWMRRQHLAVGDLDGVVLDRFVAAQSRGRNRHPSSARRIVTVRKFLLAAGLLAPASPPSVRLTPAEQVLEELRQQLRSGGLSQGWINEVCGWVDCFLAGLPVDTDGHLLWDGVDAAVVNRYVMGRGRGYSISSRRHLVSAMRALLDWAFLTDAVQASMSAGILAPASPAAPGLPRGLRPDQVQALIAAAETGTPVGRRDKAIVVLLSRLALRAGEAAALGLEDLDWHAGQLVVHGKGGRELILPIPTDVGTVLVDYLRDGRPAGAGDRALFTRSRPPLVGLSAKGISAVVATVAARAGLGTVHAHALRHTAATAVLAAGGSLIEARELLGHARTDTTMGYARTDLLALGELVPAFGKVPGL